MPGDSGTPRVPQSARDTVRLRDSIERQQRELAAAERRLRDWQEQNGCEVTHPRTGLPIIPLEDVETLTDRLADLRLKEAAAIRAYDLAPDGTQAKQQATADMTSIGIDIRRVEQRLTAAIG